MSEDDPAWLAGPWHREGKSGQGRPKAAPIGPPPKLKRQPKRRKRPPVIRRKIGPGQKVDVPGREYIDNMRWLGVVRVLIGLDPLPTSGRAKVKGDCEGWRIPCL